MGAKALWTQLAEQGHGRIPNGGLKQSKVKKPVRRITAKLAKERRIYRDLVDIYLVGRRCAFECGLKATEVHHSRGRTGKLLNDARWWIPMCRDCHAWVHRNPNQARKEMCRIGDRLIRLLALPGDWGKSE